jgi:hypothetical protein
MEFIETFYPKLILDFNQIHFYEMTENEHLHYLKV